MAELTTSQDMAAKSLATEIVLLALLREHRDDPKFWESLEKLTAAVLSLDDLATSPHPPIAAMADKAQEYLDSWRQIAGGDPLEPARPGSLPFDPEPG